MHWVGPEEQQRGVEDLALAGARPGGRAELPGWRGRCVVNAICGVAGEQQVSE